MSVQTRCSKVLGKFFVSKELLPSRAAKRALLTSSRKSSEASMKFRSIKGEKFLVHVLKSTQEIPIKA